MRRRLSLKSECQKAGGQGKDKVIVMTLFPQEVKLGICPNLLMCSTSTPNEKINYKHGLLDLKVKKKCLECNSVGSIS